MAKTLTVVLAADVDNFRRKMRSAEGQMDDFGRAGGRMGGMAGGLGMALAGAAAAAGAFAVKIGTDAVKAAMDEETELARLNTTLTNMGFGSATDQVSSFIDSLQYSANVSDSTLRPAFDRLIKSTGSVTESQKLLKLALDISAGTGKSLDSVVGALGKAYDGNTGALGKLGTGLDKATLKTGDMDSITRKLAERFDGQASAAAGTLKSKLEGVSIAAGELQEAFGAGLLDGIQGADGSISDLEQTLRDMQDSAGDVGKFIGGALAMAFYNMSLTVRALGATLSVLDKGWILLLHSLGKITDAEYNARMAAADANLAFDAQAMAAAAAGMANSAMGMFAADAGKQFEYQQYAAYGDKKALEDNAGSADDAAGAHDRLGSAVEKATPAFDRAKERLNGLTSLLQSQTAELEKATTAITTYREQLTGDIMAGVNLGQAFQQQGEEGGVSLIDAFRQQLADAGNFAGLLQQLKDSGASDQLIQQIAGMGPELGSQLAKQMLDEGLVKTISDEWNATREKIYAITSTIVPDFLILGQQNALSMLEGTETQIAKSEKRLRTIGEKVGKPIGAEIKAAIAEAVAAAVAAAEAAGKAAARNINPGGGGNSGTGGASSPGTVDVTSFGTPQAGAAALQIWLNQANSRAGITAPKVFA